MKLVDPPPQVPKRSVLLYGPPKTWKTASATTAPGPILLLNADLPNATWYAHQRAKRDGQVLHEIEYESYKETFVPIKHGIIENDLTFGGLVPEPVQTIVIDPVNELYTHMLDEFSKNAISPSLPTYQATSKHIERFCRGLCRAKNVNAVFVCHDLPVVEEGEDSRVTERLPAAGTSNPALGRKLMSMVDIVGFTVVREKEGTEEYEAVAQLVNAKGRRGGDRFDSLGNWRDMNLAEWFALPLATENDAAEEPQEEVQAA